MRVVLVSPEISHGGGQPRANLYLVRHMLAQGHMVHAIARDVDPGLRRCPSFSCDLLRGPAGPAPAAELSFQLLAARALRRAGPRDVVVNSENATLAPADLDYSQFCHSAYRRRRALDQQSALYNAYCFAFDAMNAVSEQVVYRRLSKVVVACSHLHRTSLVRDAHVPAARIRVVHNGVDTAEFRPPSSEVEVDTLRRQLGLPAAPVLLFAGDLRSPRKGLDTVLRALPLLPPDVRLLVAGDATGSPYPALVARAGLSDRVTFLGFRRDLAGYMRAADVFVFPTHYDPFGLVVLEAMASGLPAITTCMAGASEVMADGVDGLVLPDPRDHDAIAAAVDGLLRDPERRRAMGLAARATALGHDWSAVATQIESLLLKLAGAEAA